MNPPVDRHKEVHEVGDVFIQVERETDKGLIVSGVEIWLQLAPLLQTIIS